MLCLGRDDFLLKLDGWVLASLLSWVQGLHAVQLWGCGGLLPQIFDEIWKFRLKKAFLHREVFQYFLPLINADFFKIPHKYFQRLKSLGPSDIGYKNIISMHLFVLCALFFALLCIGREKNKQIFPINAINVWNKSNFVSSPLWISIIAFLVLEW